MEGFVNFLVTILSFGIAITVGIALSRHKSFLFLNERKGRYGSLDGLRGYLALAVFFHHFVITWYWKVTDSWDPPPEVYFENYGKVGVAIFFMITGFLFISKIIRDEGKTDWLKLYESRVFRIFPLYLFTLLIITAIVAYKTGFELTVGPGSLLKQYILWCMFHGGMINEFPETNTIIAWVDWTLKYEWVFYCSLPFLAFVINRLKRPGIFILIALSIYLNIYPIKIVSISTIFLITFAVGGVTAAMRKNPPLSDSAAKSKTVSAVASICLILAVLYPGKFDSTQVALIAVFFVLIVMGNDLFGLLSFRSSVLLGEISYSIYLLHGVVLYVLFSVFDIVDFKATSLQNFLVYMPFVGVLVVLFSALTYINVEKPGITLGHKGLLASKIKGYLKKADKSS